MVQKVISRFRNRKINFKVKLPIHVGSFDVLYDDQSDVATPGPGEAASTDKERSGVETGVDKEEEGEVHLQNAISASAAALLARTSAGRSVNGGGQSAASKTSTGPYIPTPDATGIVSDYAHLYPQRAFSEPSTLIRFSDTVEDVIGPAYTMDEEDVAFLLRYNSQFGTSDHGSGSGASSAAVTERNLRSPRREKGKESPAASSSLSDNDFEIIMDNYERYADERVPLLSVDLSRMPTCAEMEASFLLPENPHLPPLRPFARLVYGHWRERRLKRGGKSIISQLDYDESREDNPYVCFRRREAKIVRKTRRSETNNLERLTRLRVDLSSARDVLQLVLDRERAKRELLREEAVTFATRAALRDFKRRGQENEGDDDLLMPRERRKRRRVEDAAPALIMASNLMNSGASLKTTIRLPGRDVAGNVPVPMPQLFTEPVNAFKDRTQAVNGRIDRDMERKKLADREWEDFTDGAYCPLPLSSGVRFFRTPDTLGHSDSLSMPHATFSNSQQIMHTLGGVRPAFRKRIGRGGRILLDRLSNKGSQAQWRESANRSTRERWMHDNDVLDEVVSASDTRIVVDDFALPHILHRLALLRKGDMQSVLPSSGWLDQATAYLSAEIETTPAVQVVGRLPGRQSATYVPPQMQSSLALPSHPILNGAAGASQLSSAAAAAQNQSVVNQMLLAATHAQQVSQQNPASIRRPPNSPMTPQTLLSNGVGTRRSNSAALPGVNLPASIVASLAAGQQNHSNAAALAAAQQMMQQSSPAAMANGIGHRGMGSPAGMHAVSAN